MNQPSLFLTKEQSLSDGIGFVYVMTNSLYPDLVKIGMTSRNPEDRAKELSSQTSSPSFFKVIFFEAHHDYETLERNVHKILEWRRVNKEYFRVTPLVASLTIVTEKLYLDGLIEKRCRQHELDGVLNLISKKRIDDLRGEISRQAIQVHWGLPQSWFLDRERRGLPVPQWNKRLTLKKGGRVKYIYDAESVEKWFKANPDSIIWRDHKDSIWIIEKQTGAKP